MCEVADKVLIPLKSSKFWYFFLVIFFFLGGCVGKALIWSGRLFNIFKLKGRGQTRSGGGGGGGWYLKIVWIRAFMLYVTLTFCTF